MQVTKTLQVFPICSLNKNINTEIQLLNNMTWIMQRLMANALQCRMADTAQE